MEKLNNEAFKKSVSQGAERIKKTLAMTDVEVSQRLAEIEKLNVHRVDEDAVFVKNHQGKKKRFNPIYNDDACFRLMNKHDVTKDFEEYDFICFNYGVLDSGVPERFLSDDIGHNKAICLAIIHHYNYGISAQQ
jgi:hypothetical protein